MIGSLGFTEIAFILVLALLIFGPKRLPEIGRMVGKGLGEFRRASNDLKRTFNAELSLADDEDRPKVARTPRPEVRNKAAETRPREEPKEGPASPSPASPSPASETVARNSAPASTETESTDSEKIDVPSAKA